MLHTFLDLLAQSLHENQMHKLTLSKVRPKPEHEHLRNVYIRPIVIKQGQKLSFTYRYTTRDEVKNYDYPEGMELVEQLLFAQFSIAELQRSTETVSLRTNNKGEWHLQRTPRKDAELPAVAIPQEHNRTKQRLIQENALWLQLLSISTQQGTIKPTAQDKWRQINKYLEIIEQLLAQIPQDHTIHITDMGSGKGYLTFALYDYLCNTRHRKVNITGIELRPELVDFCNRTARQVGFTDLHFVAQDISEYQPTRLDMLIALHACDTATDLAIATGIKQKAGIIVVAPCCHKQIRRDITIPESMQAIMKHGILMERQAEILTDTIRALLLEANSYRTKVFEFISHEETSKNIMITAERLTTPRKSEEIAEKFRIVSDIKKNFGIKSHFLEHLLG